MRDLNLRTLKVGVLIVAYIATFVYAYHLDKELEDYKATLEPQIVYVYVESDEPELPEVTASVTEHVVAEVPETPKGTKLTDEEFEILVRLVAAEARGESYEGQLAVAQVIRDRMEHPNTKQYGGPSVKGVVFKKSQFAKPWSGDISKYPGISRAVEAVFYEDYRVFEEPVLFFYSPALATNQAPILKYNYVGSIGCHNFHGGIQK